MSIDLSNPKTFLPLVFFAGFLLLLIGIGFWGLFENVALIILGLIFMTVAIVLWIWDKGGF